MTSYRIIPCLLLEHGNLVKTLKFKDPKYIGDPINAVKIFNDKGVDELILLDTTVTIDGTRPNLKQIADIVSEAFMPIGYGGGINDIDDIQQLLALGIEKISLNSIAAEDPGFVSKAAELAGSQSVVVSMDVKKGFLGKYEVWTRGGSKKTSFEPVAFAKLMEQHGAGEIFLNSIDRDGTMSGYDLALIRKVASAVKIPVIACGGAGQVSDFDSAITEGGASAVAAGSMFVFHGPHRAVLISYPVQQGALQSPTVK